MVKRIPPPSDGNGMVHLASSLPRLADFFPAANMTLAVSGIGIERIAVTMTCFAVLLNSPPRQPKPQHGKQQQPQRYNEAHHAVNSLPSRRAVAQLRRRAVHRRFVSVLVDSLLRRVRAHSPVLLGIASSTQSRCRRLFHPRSATQTWIFAACRNH